MSNKKVADVYRTQKVGEIHKKSSGVGTFFGIVIVIVILIAIF